MKNIKEMEGCLQVYVIVDVNEMFKRNFVFYFFKLIFGTDFMLCGHFLCLLTGMICVNGKRESQTKSTRLFGLPMVNDNVFNNKTTQNFQSDYDLFQDFFFLIGFSKIG